MDYVAIFLPPSVNVRTMLPPMSLKPRFSDLLVEYRIRHHALWEGLALLEPEEWRQPVWDDGETPRELLAQRVVDDSQLLNAIEAAAVGLPDMQGVVDASPAQTHDSLLGKAVALAERVDKALSGLDNHQWQRKLHRDRQPTALAEFVADVNAAHCHAQRRLDDYLASYERLGKQGLKRWLREVYNAVMDSVAGMNEQAIMGQPWYGDWNTYQLLEHVWAWNQQALELARRWDQPGSRPAFDDLPVYGRFNPYLGKPYEGDDMVAIADGIVTVYRKTALLIEAAEPEALQQERDWPGRGRGSLCAFLYTLYRHAWRHALAIQTHRQETAAATPDSFPARSS